MDWQHYISEQFHASVNNLLNAIEPLSPILATAGEAMANALLNEQRIFCAGLGNAQLLASRFSSILLHRFEHERPSLPVFNISSDASLMTSIIHDHGLNDAIAKPLRSLGQTNDVAVLFACDSNDHALLQAIQAAHDRNMSVILIGTTQHQECRSLLQSTDLDIYIGAEHPAREFELLLFCVHSLCDLIEKKLFFGEDS
jgi:D-sedoheptulose 7-phosphate isomerase